MIIGWSLATIVTMVWIAYLLGFISGIFVIGLLTSGYKKPKQKIR
jgi:hypothetical protein